MRRYNSQSEKFRALMRRLTVERLKGPKAKDWCEILESGSLHFAALSKPEAQVFSPCALLLQRTKHTSGQD